MRIGICDDNGKDAQRIAFVLSDISPNLEIVCFDTGSALLDAVKDKSFDLVFLDVFLKQENGMDVAVTLRQSSPDTQIVFSTISRDFALEAFQIQAADYLVKPYSDMDIVKAFSRANVRQKQQKPDSVLLKAGREMRAFRPQDVVSIESDKHYTLLTAADGTQTRLHLSYSKVAPQFPEPFVEVRRGITVNLAYVSGVNGNTLMLTDGSRCTVSRAKLDAVIQSYTRFVSEN